MIELTFNEAQYQFQDNLKRILYLKVVACDNGTFRFFLYIDGAIKIEREGSELPGIPQGSTLTEILDTHWVPILVSVLLREIETPQKL